MYYIGQNFHRKPRVGNRPRYLHTDAILYKPVSQHVGLLEDKNMRSESHVRSLIRLVCPAWLCLFEFNLRRSIKWLVSEGAKST